MATTKASHVQVPDGPPALEIHARGIAVLDDPMLNRGTAFTMDERDHLGLRGLLPPGVETIEQQVDRCYEQFKSKRSDVEKWVFLSQLHDSNEVLFYRLVGEHVHETGARDERDRNVRTDHESCGDVAEHCRQAQRFEQQRDHGGDAEHDH